ncbi:hypothetical protein Vafri_14238, partial [Volvox africanus]
RPASVEATYLVIIRVYILQNLRVHRVVERFSISAESTLQQLLRAVFQNKGEVRSKQINALQLLSHIYSRPASEVRRSSLFICNVLYRAQYMFIYNKTSLECQYNEKRCRYSSSTTWWRWSRCYRTHPNKATRATEGRGTSVPIIQKGAPYLLSQTSIISLSRLHSYKIIKTGMPSRGSSGSDNKATAAGQSSFPIRNPRNHHFQQQQQQQEVSAGSSSSGQRSPATTATTATTARPTFDNDEWPALPSFQTPSNRDSQNNRTGAATTARKQAAVAVAAAAAAALSPAAAATTGLSRTSVVAAATPAATPSQVRRPGGVNGGKGSPQVKDANRGSSRGDDGGGGGGSSRMASLGHSFSQPNSIDYIPLVTPAFEDVLLTKPGSRSGSGSGTRHGFGSGSGSGSGASASCGGAVQSNVMMKHIRVKDTVVVLEYVSTSPEETNRLVMAYGTDPFAVVHFEVRYGSPKEVREYIDKVLRAGVRIGPHMYNFLGHSNEQLKTRTCVLFRTDSHKQIEKLLSNWIDYTGIASVAKRAKRTALLFSRFRPVPLPEHLRRHEDIEDLVVPGGDAKYTDGCGYCSMEFARYLSRYLNIRHRGRRYVPSMFQIRYLGFKGVVVVQPGLDERNVRMRDEQHKVHMQLRTSMCKFKIPKEPHQQQQQQQQQQKEVENGGEKPEEATAAAAAAVTEASAVLPARLVFGVCDYSKPYKYGYLNSQAVMLLSALGVPDAVLEARQNTYLEELVRLQEGGEVAVRHLLAADKVEEAELLAGYGGDPVERTDSGALHGTIKSREGRERPRVISQVLKSLQRDEVDKLVKELPPRPPKHPQQRQQQGGRDLASVGTSKQQAPPPPYLRQQQQQHLGHQVDGDQQSTARDSRNQRSPAANALEAASDGDGGRFRDRGVGDGNGTAESSRSGNNSSSRAAGNGRTTRHGGGEQMRGPYALENAEGDIEEGPLQDAVWDSLTAADFGPDYLGAATGEEMTHGSSAGGCSPLDPVLYGADTVAPVATAAAAPSPNELGGDVTAAHRTAAGKRISAKIRIRLEQSRRVFGVADPSREWPAPPSPDHNGPRSPQQLLYGQCFFQPLVDGQPQSLVGGHILMVGATSSSEASKMPPYNIYSRGDISLGVREKVNVMMQSRIIALPAWEDDRARDRRPCLGPRGCQGRIVLVD